MKKKPTTAREHEVARLHRSRLDTARMGEAMGVSTQRAGALLKRLGLVPIRRRSPAGQGQSRNFRRTAAEVHAQATALRADIARLSVEHPAWTAAQIATAIGARASTVRTVRRQINAPRPAPHRHSPAA